MKKFTVLAVIFSLFASMMTAQVQIAKREKVEPDMMLYLDMALTAAKNEKAADGVALIQYGAPKAFAAGTANKQAVLEAIAKTGKKKLTGYEVYCVNEPSTEAYIALCRAGVDAVYFVNSRDQVAKTALGYVYDDSTFPEDLAKVPFSQLDFDDATSYIRSFVR